MVGLGIFLVCLTAVGFLYFRKNREQLFESMSFSKFIGQKPNAADEKLFDSGDKGIAEKINDFFASDSNTNFDDDGDGDL